MARPSSKDSDFGESHVTIGDDAQDLFSPSGPSADRTPSNAPRPIARPLTAPFTINNAPRRPTAAQTVPAGIRPPNPNPVNDAPRLNAGRYFDTLDDGPSPAELEALGLATAVELQAQEQARLAEMTSADAAIAAQLQRSLDTQAKVAQMEADAALARRLQGGDDGGSVDEVGAPAPVDLAIERRRNLGRGTPARAQQPGTVTVSSTSRTQGPGSVSISSTSRTQGPGSLGISRTTLTAWGDPVSAPVQNIPPTAPGPDLVVVSNSVLNDLQGRGGDFVYGPPPTTRPPRAVHQEANREVGSRAREERGLDTATEPTRGPGGRHRAHGDAGRRSGGGHRGSGRKRKRRAKQEAGCCVVM